MGEFNFRLGTDPTGTTAVETGELMETIRAAWRKNTLKPSNTSFVSGREGRMGKSP